jgi:hypothetical protein
MNPERANMKLTDNLVKEWDSYGLTTEERLIEALRELEYCWNLIKPKDTTYY